MNLTWRQLCWPVRNYYIGRAGGFQQHASPAMADKLDKSLDDIIEATGGTKGKAKALSGGGVFSRLGNNKRGGGGGARGRGGRESRGGRGGCNGRPSQTAEMRRTRQIVDEGGDTVVKLSDAEVLRISGVDIILSMGGAEELTPLVVECMNETLNEFGFKMNENGNGEWFLSDGKYRLIRFHEGVVIEGAAVVAEAELAAGEWGAAKGGSKGPKGGAKGWAGGRGWGKGVWAGYGAVPTAKGKGATRFAPY